MLKINEVRLSVMEEDAALLPKCAKLLHLKPAQIAALHVLRRSLDARKKPQLFFSYTVLLKTRLSNEEALVRRLKNKSVSLALERPYASPFLPEGISAQDKEAYFSVEAHRPLVVGFGPAGIFAALLLARAGMRPIVYERGAEITERVRDVERLWREGILDPSSNPQFGEGGAGAFSDGKLNTLVKDPAGRDRFVLETFVRYGADPDILVDAKPHIGTDRLRDIVRGIREEILSLGGEVHFHRKFTRADYEARGERKILLALGHSARDSLEELFSAGLPMEAKDFAMGFRVQHPQSMIDRQQYGEVSPACLAKLGPASYKLHYTARNGRRVYSFCMCPGGYVLDASSEVGRMCVNGMSYHDRAGENANAAIIVGIRKEDFGGGLNPLGGMYLQRELEERAYRLGNGRIPMQRYGDFRRAVLDAAGDGGKNGHTGNFPEGREAKCGDQDGTGLSNEGLGGVVRPMFRGRYQEAGLEGLFRFPEGSAYGTLNNVNEAIVEAMEHFGGQIPGFDRADAILSAVEARTSSPVRIPRNDAFTSAVPGIYPCGEGAGYAGGIMSAAMDGMKAAEALVKAYENLI